MERLFPFIFGIACTEQTDVPMEGTLQVLTYNIHGLPPEITNDDTASRVQQIAPLLEPYTLVGLQEDWITDNRESLLNLPMLPYSDVFDELLNEQKVYGAGLTTLSAVEIESSEHIYYEHCYGYLESASDCFASKGLQATSIKLGKTEVSFLNTHLEAGGDEEDYIVAEIQITKIIETINATVNPIILVGDFNLRPTNPRDQLLLERLENETGLRNVCWELDCFEPNHIDQVWIRSTNDFTLQETAWIREEHFIDSEGVDLSDHPAISVELSWY